MDKIQKIVYGTLTIKFSFRNSILIVLILSIGGYTLNLMNKIRLGRFCCVPAMILKEVQTVMQFHLENFND